MHRADHAQEDRARRRAAHARPAAVQRRARGHPHRASRVPEPPAEFRQRYEVPAQGIIPEGYMDGRRTCLRILNALEHLSHRDVEDLRGGRACGARGEAGRVAIRHVLAAAGCRTDVYGAAADEEDPRLCSRGSYNSTGREDLWGA